MPKKTIDTTNIMTYTTLTHECSTIVVLMFILKIVVSINAMTLKQICEMRRNYIRNNE